MKHANAARSYTQSVVMLVTLSLQTFPRVIRLEETRRYLIDRLHGWAFRWLSL